MGGLGRAVVRGIAIEVETDFAVVVAAAAAVDVVGRLKGNLGATLRRSCFRWLKARFGDGITGFGCKV